MSRKYYYLVAGFPNLVESLKGFSYVDVRQEVMENLSAGDCEQLKWLLLRHDNVNIFNLINKKQDFDSRGWFSKNEIEENLNDIDILPEYLQTFLKDRKEEKESVPGLGVFEQLSYLYHKDISARGKWFAAWTDFSIDLQNVVAALNARDLGVSAEKSVILLNDNAEKIAKSRAVDFGLGNLLPWIEQIAKNFNDPLELEKTIDDIYWKKVDELSEDDEFGIGSVLGFMVKADSIERWLRLDTERGITQAENLIEKLKSSLQNQK
jgi:hypothetical protein